MKGKTFLPGGKKKNRIRNLPIGKDNYLSFKRPYLKLLPKNSIIPYF